MRITSGSSIRWRRFADEIQLTRASFGDDAGIDLGADSDIVIFNRSTSLSADAEVTGVIEGISDHLGVTANSLIISNITDNGDIMFLVSDAGVSKGLLKLDGTNGRVVIHGGDLLMSGAQKIYFYDVGGEYMSSDGATLTITGETALTPTVGSTAWANANHTHAGSSTGGTIATSTLASTVVVVDSTDTSAYVALFDSATGCLAAKTDAGITYNAGTGMLTATGFTGPLTGNASGTAATVTGGTQACITTLTALTTIGAAGATTNVVAGDVTMYNAVNNGNPTISLGSACAERLIITTNYDSGAQTLCNVEFATAAASGTANKGKFVFDVDGTDIATIDDGGIDLASGKTFAINGSDIVITDTTYTAGDGLTLTGTDFDLDAALTTVTSILATDVKIGEDDQTKVDFADANIINLHANNIKALSVHNTSSKGELRFYEGCNYVGFAAPALSGEQIWTLPAAVASSACDVLTCNGSGVLSWATAGGQTINNATANELVTIGATTTELCAEANLTFDGTTLTVANASCRQVLVPNGAVAKPAIAAAADTNTGLYFPSAETLALSSGGVELVRYECPGRIFVRDTANGGLTVGLTLNQLANDNQILALKSSDTCHSFTSKVEADTFAGFYKMCGNNGGLRIESYNGNNSPTLSMLFKGYAYDSNTAKNAGGNAPVEVRAATRNCSTGVSSEANMAIFSVAREDNGNVLFMVDLEGDYFYYGSGSDFDEYCDVGLVRAFSTTTARSQGRCHQIIRSKWDDHVKENEETLVKLGVLGDYVNCVPPCKVGLVNAPQLQRLHNGAIWQLYTRIADQGEEIKKLQTQLTALNGGK